MQIGNRCIDNPGCMNGTLNSITGKCECNSPSLQFHDNIGCICIDSNSIFDPTTQSCVCTGNNYKLNDKCTPCWQHSIVSVTKLSCVCINNYVLNQQGNGCIPAGCTGTAIYNIVTGQCQCGNGFTYSATLGCVCNG